MITAVLCAAPVLVLAGCAAYAFAGRIRAAVLRARWAWRCHGAPPPDSEINPLDRWESRELLAIRRGLKGATARPEGSRT